MKLHRTESLPTWTEDNPAFLVEIDKRLEALEEGKPFPAIDTPMAHWNPGAIERVQSGQRDKFLKIVGAVAATGTGFFIIWQAPNFVRSVLEWSAKFNFKH